MGIFSKFFGKEEPAMPEDSQHAVIVSFQYGSTDLQPAFDLEGQLESAIIAADVGEFDGDLFAEDGSEGFFYMYGPDADKLYEAIRPVLESSSLMKGAVVKLQYGPPEDVVKEKEIKLT